MTKIFPPIQSFVFPPSRVSKEIVAAKYLFRTCDVGKTRPQKFPASQLILVYNDSTVNGSVKGSGKEKEKRKDPFLADEWRVGMRKVLHRLARNGTKFMAWLVELLQPMQSQLGPISFHFIEAERHRYTAVIKSTSV